MYSFFQGSIYLDRDVLRPLSHIMGCWELSWDHEKKQYEEEDSSYAAALNTLIVELSNASPPESYHDHEDRLAEYVMEHLRWPICKIHGRWVGMDYASVIEQGSVHDFNEHNLILAAAGRVKAALSRGQQHFDQMEPSHRRMLAAVLSIILYRRTPGSIFSRTDQSV